MTEPRTALDAIGVLPDTEIDIADAALQLARVDAPDADWQSASAHLSALARDAAALATLDTLPARVEALGDLLVERHGYAGDDRTYDDLANANLIRVIERRRGLPVALGILWLHTARAAGWAAHGVDFPAHFLISLHGAGGSTVLDVFHGGAPLGTAELRVLLRRVEGESAELRPGLLRPMSARGVLLRLQNNIATRRMAAGDLTGTLDCVTDMLRIAPDQAELWQQAGVMNHRLDRVGAALRCFDRFLGLVPQGAAADRIRATVEQLRRHLN